MVLRLDRREETIGAELAPGPRLQQAQRLRSDSAAAAVGREEDADDRPSLIDVEAHHAHVPTIRGHEVDLPLWVAEARGEPALVVAEVDGRGVERRVPRLLVVPPGPDIVAVRGAGRTKRDLRHRRLLTRTRARRRSDAARRSRRAPTHLVSLVRAPAFGGSPRPNVRSAAPALHSISQVSTASSGMSILATRPTTRSTSFGRMPKPGRLIVIIERSITVPRGIAHAAMRLRRAFWCISRSSGAGPSFMPSA